jgi:uncharacterized membrane-anchored protein
MHKIKNPLFIVFIVIVLIQLSIPASIVFRGERIIAIGKEYKFKTAPVDPNDPFRGKYIALRFEANHFTVYDTAIWDRNKPVYVCITTDDKGFAEISDITSYPPDNNTDFVKAKIDYTQTDSITTTLYIRYPFDRYYMEESKSLSAEKIYWESSRDSTKNTYALVNIKQGSAVLKDVMINEVPLKDLIKK